MVKIVKSACKVSLHCLYYRQIFSGRILSKTGLSVILSIIITTNDMLINCSGREMGGVWKRFLSVAPVEMISACFGSLN